MQISPMDFVTGLENFFIAKSNKKDKLCEWISSGRIHNTAKYKALIKAMPDVERQGAAYNALLARCPKLLTKCCKHPFCFTCKVGSFHREKTCEERLRDECMTEVIIYHFISY
jgi:hypothetical protein